LELVKILYQHNATIYIAARNREKGDKAITTVKEEFPDSKAKLAFLQLDLADQSTIKKSADEFLAKESRLDVLTLNAGVMAPPSGSKDAAGHELQIGTNCLGSWLFTHYLVPILKKTAASSPPGSVRVTWPASIAIAFAPTGGVSFDQDGNVKVHGLQAVNYSQSKVGNAYLASEFGRRYGSDGIVSVSWNPGNLKSELQRHGSALENLLLWPALYHPKFGAYTELYAACSPDLSTKDNGAFIIPWGRIGHLRPDMVKAEKTKEEGGTGEAQRFWEWCEKECKAYL
jgi:retinol dehydrogenase-12